MKAYLQKFSLHSINLLGISILFFFALIFTFLVIFEEYRDFEQESEFLRSTYLDTQKQKAKDETLRVLNYIDYFHHSMQGQMNEEMLKKSVISSIEHLFDRKNSSNYIFIYTLDGVNISDPNKPQYQGKNMLDIQDINKVYIVKGLIEQAKNGGGYLEYIWENPANGELSPKVSYGTAYMPWGWLVGTGIYLNEIDTVIAQNKENLKDRLVKYVMEILTLSAILFWFAFAGIKLINGIIHNEISTFREFFQQSVLHNIVIDKKQIRIKEFQILVSYVNEMVFAIHKKNNELKELNASLEEKVLQKTAKLKKQMKFNEELVAAQDNFIKHSIHEINTPLAVIMTHIDIYKMKYGENRYLTKIEAAAKMIATIYDDLSYMVKRNRLDYVKEWLDIKGYLTSRVRFFEEIAQGNQHRIVTHFEECDRLWFNELELQRIIDNNLSNAIKYAKGETDIHVELYCDDKDVVMRFITDSKKIEDTKKIFEPFHREELYESGFGLGLEIVGSICKKENVTIDVISEENMTIFSYRFKRKESHESSLT